MPNFEKPSFQFPGKEFFIQLGWHLHASLEASFRHAPVAALAGRGDDDPVHRRRWPGARKRR